MGGSPWLASARVTPPRRGRREMRSVCEVASRDPAREVNSDRVVAHPRCSGNVGAFDGPSGAGVGRGHTFHGLPPMATDDCPFGAGDSWALRVSSEHRRMTVRLDRYRNHSTGVPTRVVMRPRPYTRRGRGPTRACREAIVYDGGSSPASGASCVQSCGVPYQSSSFPPSNLPSRFEVNVNEFRCS